MSAKSTRRKATDVINGVTARLYGQPDEGFTADIVEALDNEGIILITKAGHRRALDQAATDRQRADYAERDAENARTWARQCAAEERRLARRLTNLIAAVGPVGANLDTLNARLDDEARLNLEHAIADIGATDPITRELGARLLEHLEQDTTP